MEEHLIMLKTEHDQLMGIVAASGDEHQKGIEMIIDYFLTLFSGLARHGMVFGLLGAFTNHHSWSMSRSRLRMHKILVL